MNRKVMRKSTLISSIAMLLVAVLALSGVTFAWFSSKPTATAGNVTMKSNTVAGLYIGQSAYKGTESGPESWGSSLNWTVSAELTPASCAFLNGNDTFYTTTSTRPDGKWSDAPISTEVTAIAADDVRGEVKGHYVAQRIWLDADLSDAETQNLVMTVNFAGTGNQPYAKFVIVNDATKEATVFANSQTMYYPIISTSVNDAGKTSITTAAEGEGVTPNLVGTPYNLIPDYDGEVVSFTIYFYLEGQDPTCNNGNSRSNVEVSLVFELKDAA